MKYLTSANNEFEATIIAERLGEAGISPLVQGGPSGRGISVAIPRDIYVEDQDFERAHEVLKAAEDTSDEELAELSDAAAQPTRAERGDNDGKPHEPGETPVRKRRAWGRIFGR